MTGVLKQVRRVAAAKNGQAYDCEVDATQFLLSHPRGAYTAARTVNQTRIFDYEGHLQRLVDSVNAMHRTIGLDVPDVTRSAVEEAVKATLKAGMQAFHQTHGKVPQEEYKVTVLVCDHAKDAKKTEEAEEGSLLAMADVFCHVAVLPALRNELCHLQVKGLPRHNASAKDSKWVRDRKAIYDALPADVEEIVLMDPETQELVEGSQTNFYVIEDGRVMTAQEGILEGTVRRLVLEVCAAKGIQVVLQAPRLTTVEKWEGCFISSTSRLVLGAEKLEYPMDRSAGKGMHTKTFKRTAVLDTIIQGVRNMVESKSSEVF